jgi:hypothetical protein
MPRDETLAAEHGLAGRFNIIFAGNQGLRALENVLNARAIGRCTGSSICPDWQWVEGINLITARPAIVECRFIDRQPGTNADILRSRISS